MIHSYIVLSTENRTLEELKISNQKRIDVIFEGQIVGG